MIGQKISPILSEIEDTLWEFEFNRAGQPNYTDDGFKAAIKIFMSALLDKMWNLQENENIDINDRIEMAKNAGNDIRNLIKIYSNIDTHDLYK